MNNINIEDIDLNNTLFHFTAKDNLKSIEEKGLIAQIGDASKMVNDKPRVCLSRGGKGLLGIKNSFIHMFKNLRICDIPEDYRKYFTINDFSDTSQVSLKLLYDAMERRFKDEIYLKVDAKEGVDFLREEIHGLGSDFDIKGKEGHNISPNKLSVVTTQTGNSALNIIQYIYNRLLEKNPGKENIIRNMNSDLTEMLDYINLKSKISMKDIVSKAISDGINIEDIQDLDRENSDIRNMEEFTKDE